MATELELQILAREAWHLIHNEHVPEKMAVTSVLKAYKDIMWYGGIKRDIGIRISDIRKAERQKETHMSKSAKSFTTFAEKSVKDN